MRAPRDFRPGQIYGITQRGNNGQWTYVDDEDFQRSVTLMGKCARRYGVKVHFYCLVHNHGHWMLESGTEESISCVMRDMQGQYSRYLNKKYRRDPGRLMGPLKEQRKGGRKRRRGHSRFLRKGPVNWAPRFDARLLDAKGIREFARYIELNPVRAKLVDSAEKWPWSSAGAHFAGTDGGGLLCLDAWAAFFGAPDVAAAAAAWREYVEAPIAEAIANALRVRRTVPFNRVTWDAPWEGEVRVAAAPG